MGLLAAWQSCIAGSSSARRLPKLRLRRRTTSSPSIPNWVTQFQGLQGTEPAQNRVLQGSAPFEENRAQFERWYTKYFFPSFTKLDKLRELPEHRLELIGQLVSARSAPPLEIVCSI